MKNRSFTCYALDIFGLISLAGAALALALALWFKASVAESLLLTAFGYCMFASVGAFLAARVSELMRVFATASVEPVALPPLSDNVEPLAGRTPLRRAA